MRSSILLLLLCLLKLHGFAQYINAYAKVDAISGNTLILSSVNENYDSFEDLEEILLIQMQDDVIGTTANIPSFGDLGSIGSAGLYEKLTIQSHTELGGLPSTVTVSSALVNSYQISANASVQIVSFPRYGSPDYTLSTPFSALAWNGSVGGVLAFKVNGILTIGANISADGSGFRAGDHSNNWYMGGTPCNDTPYYTSSANYGEKGEGIYKISNPNYGYARGKILNGGGGGNRDVNGGGAGGGNFTAGGKGGEGWHASFSFGCTPEIGGMGGIGLASHIDHNRFFMGGGGGGGQQNNTAASEGSAGGGIVYIQANEISTACAGSVKISANGPNAPNAGNDGAGGAGAGGSVVLEVDTWSAQASCPLVLQANGGTGGTVANAGYHGGGGGGGQGTVIFFSVQPTTNITTETLPGNGGRNCSSCGSTQGGFGAPGDGIIDILTGVLPSVDFDFQAKDLGPEGIQLSWQFPVRLAAQSFEIDRSADGNDWQSLEKISLSLDDIRSSQFEFIDEAPMQGRNFYRLSATLPDGQNMLSSTISVDYQQWHSLFIFPNPANEQFTVSGDFSAIRQLYLLDALGRRWTPNYEAQSNQILVHCPEIPAGPYCLQFWDGKRFYQQKILID